MATTEGAASNAGIRDATIGAVKPVADPAAVSHKRSHADPENDDGATTPPTKSLKQTSISDKGSSSSTTGSRLDNELVPADHEQTDDSPIQPTTPIPSAASVDVTTVDDEEMKEQVASPKKKRGRDQDDETKDSEVGDDQAEESVASIDAISNNSGRTSRLAPEKKRPRDSIGLSLSEETGSDKNKPQPGETDQGSLETASEATKPETSAAPSVADAIASGSENTPQSSSQTSSAFANSAFGALASKPSGFAALAGKPSVFGSGSTTPATGFGGSGTASGLGTGFGSAAMSGASTSTSSAPAAPALSFSSGSQSGFASLGSSTGFGSGFGGGFGSSFAPNTIGPKLSSFAASKPQEPLETAKPAKAFGAPDSEAEDDSDDDEDPEGQRPEEEDEVAVEEKRKTRMTKVALNDGEENEATLTQFRAKLFALESKEAGWKERGVGIVKVNVPKAYVDYDHNGVPDLESYDTSPELETEEGASEPVAARLIMRQENTHRVIMNSPIIKALAFEQKTTNKGMQVLFTAFEDAKPMNMLLKMNTPNCTEFMHAIDCIQREL